MSEQMGLDDQQGRMRKRVSSGMKRYYDIWIVTRIKDVGCNRQDIDHDLLGKQLQAVGCQGFEVENFQMMRRYSMRDFGVGVSKRWLQRENKVGCKQESAQVTQVWNKEVDYLVA